MRGQKLEEKPIKFLISFLIIALMTAGCNSSGGGVKTTGAPAPATPSSQTPPVLADQWYLINTGQLSGTSGEDINVDPVWASFKGDGVRVVVVDDGMEATHAKLAANYTSSGSWNYVTNTNNPTNPTSDTDSGHGTSVAGIIAARDSSSTDLRGVAPRVTIAGYNLLNNFTTSNEASAMTRNAASVAVSSNSWGAVDNKGILQPANATWKTGIETGLSTGRGGKGTVYVWAAGNGGGASGRDNSNYDGQANYHGVMAVAAVTNRGVASSYSEAGANVWIAAPGGEFCSTHAITTIDRTGNVGFNGSSSAGSTDVLNQDYTKCMNGTSSATPMISGVAALMIEANPSLGWRDVKMILAQTARKNDPTSPGWSNNGAGLHVHHSYGFGVVDAKAAVDAAVIYTSYLAPQIQYSTSLSSPALAIPDNNATGVSDTINVSGSGINNIEFVEVTFSATDHPYAADLKITLTSPAGTSSVLAVTHSCSNNTCVAYNGWVFGVARHLNEPADGNWTLSVKDLANTDTGTFQSWKLNFRGH
ncbi:MAG: S8 family serine peptidase [Bacteriovoracaceae bacterium]|nr:S8 family serine peptidase [Bacteriovoracaceae bacterium]